MLLTRIPLRSSRGLGLTMVDYDRHERDLSYSQHPALIKSAQVDFLGGEGLFLLIFIHSTEERNLLVRAERRLGLVNRTSIALG